MIKRGYGCDKDLPDARDYGFVRPPELIALPPGIDLRAKCPPVDDQGQTESCTAHAPRAAFWIDHRRQNLGDFLYSRRFLWYNTRKLEGTIAINTGCSIRDVFKTMAKDGVCEEKKWPFLPSKYAQKPLLGCYNAAKKHKAIQYMALAQDPAQVKACLASGYPVIFGFRVPQSFESAEMAKTGIMKMPSSKEQRLGGHAVSAVGYQDLDSMMIVRNSWSEKWGLAGYFMMPYEFFFSSSEAFDFWTVRVVS